jgi:hypothetical protein
MILDRLLTFTGDVATGTIFDNPTTGAQDSTNIIDLGVGAPPPNQATPDYAHGGGARDIGVGDDPMLKLLIQVTTTFAGGTDLSAALQGAPDNGSGFPGAWTTMWQSPAPVALAGLTVGAYISNVDVPRQITGQPMPRFLKVVFTSTGTFTGGGVYAGIVIDRFDQPWGGIPAGGAGLGGYVPGVVVPN